MTESNRAFGAAIMARVEDLASISETAAGLTCTYMTPAHQATASRLKAWMEEAGLAASIDALGNVTGRYPSANPNARTLLVGSHYDTVRNAGKYDGRLGVLTALAVVADLAQGGIALPYHLEVVAFSEEEGVRFATTFLGSRALVGQFDMAALAMKDADGVTMEAALRAAGHDPATIPALARDPASLLGYIELHIEQGPVLLEKDMPLGVVTGIAGGIRLLVSIAGTAGHAGTVPMGLRHDAAAAAAEIVLLVERRCSAAPGLVGTVGMLTVPNGAINVIPGRCELTLDIRAPDDATRDAAVADIRAEMAAIAARRGVTIAADEVMRAAAVPCATPIQEALASAITRAGLPVVRLASGAGHDAMMLGTVTAAGMMFVRCGNGGISHNPLETVTVEDADVAARVLRDVLVNLPG